MIYRLVLSGVLLLVWSTVSAAPKPKEITATDVDCTACIDSKDIAADSVGQSEIQDGAVGESELTQALLDRINALEAALATAPKPARVFANDEPIGTLIQFTRAGNEWLRVLSPNGYVFDVENTIGDETGTLAVTHIYFETTDCTGAAYIPWGDMPFEPSAGPQGVVFEADQGLQLGARYYKPTGSAPRSRTMKSYLVGGCSAYGGNGRLYYEVFPNDPVITGVPNERYAPPIIIGY